jgi:hypothetical protein
MTDTVNLPPLPEPAGSVGHNMFEWHVSDDTKEMELERGCDVYTASQTRAYGAECARQAVERERERCAKLCDALPDWPEYADNHDVSDGASACAAAIRKAP